MFVGHEVVLQGSFAAARERLVQLTADGGLISVSEDAYGRGTASLTPAGAASPSGLASPSRLVRVHLRGLAGTDRSAGLAIRWVAAGSGGGLFPVLDADLSLASVGEQVTLLTMAAAYRLPPGPPGEALDPVILQRVAATTVRHFVVWVAAQITGRPATAEATASNGARSRPPAAPSQT